MSGKGNKMDQLDFDAQKVLTVRFDEEVTSNCMEHISYLTEQTTSSSSNKSTDKIPQDNSSNEAIKIKSR